MRARVGDLASVVSIWFIVAFLIGSEPWVSLDTPDSEFHASMAIFGSEVTDRAAVPVYYWTRLGFIAPARLLTYLAGPIMGLEVLRLILLFLIILGVWIAVRRFTDVWTAIILTLVVSANTVILGYLGNPYPSATVMAGMALLIAIGIRPRSWIGDLSSGLIVGWIVMTNPYGAILAVVTYVAVFMSRGGNTWRRVIRGASLGSLGAGASFTILWAIGQALFPKLNWLETYLFWNSTLNQADYIYDPLRWQYDPSLLVPAMGMVMCVLNWVLHPRDLSARIGAVLATAVTGFALVYLWVFPTNYLEIPHYQALLWVPTLSAICVVAAGRVPTGQFSWIRVSVGIVVVTGTIAAGYTAISVSVWQGRVIAATCVGLFLVAGRRWVPVIVVTGLIMMGAQILQNSRDTFGVSTESLYVNAYRANETRMMMESAVVAQRWILQLTRPQDRTLTWVDAEWREGEQDLLPLAAFQLWGANSAEQGPKVTPDTVRRWEATKPLSLALYGKSTEAVLDFWRSIPRERRASVPQCVEVPWPGYTGVQVCVTRLTW